MSEKSFAAAWFNLTGFDVTPFFDQHVYGDKPIDVRETLLLIGVQLESNGSFKVGPPTAFAQELFQIK